MPITFDFTGVGTDVNATRFSTFALSTFGFTTSTTVTRGATPVVFDSFQTNAGLNGDTMTFTVTPQSTFYQIRMDSGNDSLDLGPGPGTNITTASFTIAFTDGGGQDELLNPIANFSGVGDALWITTGGALNVAAVSGAQYTGTVTGMRFTTLPGTSLNLSSLSGDSLACFARNTDIATPKGQRAVQDLKIGDLVMTADGEERAVKWVGRQTLDTKFGMPERMRPVRISAGAFGGGVPVRDLVVTADHAMLLDGLLINAGALVNGESIRFDTPDRHGTRFTVYHVETEDHAIILAEGAAAETFLDSVTRQAFDNYAEYVELYGEGDLIEELPMPRISSARLLPKALKDRLTVKVAA